MTSNPLHHWLKEPHHHLPEEVIEAFKALSEDGKTLLMLQKHPQGPTPTWHILCSQQDAYDAITEMYQDEEEPADYILLVADPETPTREVTQEEFETWIRALPDDFLDVQDSQIKDLNPQHQVEHNHLKESLKWHLNSNFKKDPDPDSLHALYAELIQLNAQPPHLTLGKSRQAIKRHAANMPDLPEEQKPDLLKSPSTIPEEADENPSDLPF